VIVKNLVDHINGGIDLESVEGEGTCFTVRIPLRIAPRPHMFRPHRFMTVKAAPAGQKQKTGKASLPVLVVESNEPNALAATATLRDLGYRYDVVKNGREAVRKFTAQKYALILMNIRMEDMNGLEATRLIRRIEKKKNLMPTPIIAAMGQASEDRRESCLRAGMDGFIAKPLRRGDMAALLHRHAAGTKKNDGGFLLLDDLADENITDTAHRLD
jgi:CheY-like chemotaxis protein